MSEYIDFSQIDWIEWILIIITGIVYIMISAAFITMIRMERKKCEKKL